MAYLQIDDQAADHPKLAALSDKAFRLWFSGCTYAQRFLTNGRLQASVVSSLRGYSSKAATELRTIVPPFEHPLWEEHPEGGIQIHDFLHWNQSRADVLKRREEKKARMQAAREHGRFARGMTQNGHVPDTSEKRVTALNHNLTVAKATAQSGAPIVGRRNLAVLNDSDPVHCPSILSEEFQAVIRPRLPEGADSYTALLTWIHTVSDRTVATFGGAPKECIGKGAFDWWRAELAKDWGVTASQTDSTALTERKRQLGIA